MKSNTKKRIKYTDEPMDRVELVSDFLPPPEELMLQGESIAKVKPNEKGLRMTQLLTKAFEKAAQLPEPDQIAFANFILAELASDLRWQQAFDRSHNLLAQLADEALAEHRAGGTLELDPDKL